MEAKCLLAVDATPGRAAPFLQPWPRSFPADSNGTLALFDATVQIPFAGFWTYAFGSPTLCLGWLSFAASSCSQAAVSPPMVLPASSCQDDKHDCRFFITSSSPMELTVSKNGDFYEVERSGGEDETVNGTDIGSVHQIQFDLPAGLQHLCSTRSTLRVHHRKHCKDPLHP